MTVTVVQFLEIIDVDHIGCQFPAVHPGNVRLKRQPVLQTGQTVPAAGRVQRLVGLDQPHFIGGNTNLDMAADRVGRDGCQRKHDQVQHLQICSPVINIQGNKKPGKGRTDQQRSDPWPENDETDHQQIYHVEGQHLLSPAVMAVVHKDRPDVEGCKEKDFEKEEMVMRQIFVFQHASGKKNAEDAKCDAISDTEQGNKRVLIKIPDMGREKNNQRQRFKENTDQ